MDPIAAAAVLGLAACAAPDTLPPPGPAPAAGPTDAPPELVLDWTPEAGHAGSLGGTDPSGEYFAGQLQLPEPGDPQAMNPGTARPGSESGADLFGPFPEQWPRRGKGTRVTLRFRLLSASGAELDCAFPAQNLDGGLATPLDGQCRRPDGSALRARIQ